MFYHSYVIEALNTHLPLKDKIVSAYRVIKENFDFVARISVTLYDSEACILKTFIDSSGEANPIHNYQIILG